jgi:hypothetical protein
MAPIFCMASGRCTPPSFMLAHPPFRLLKGRFLSSPPPHHHHFTSLLTPNGAAPQSQACKPLSPLAFNDVWLWAHEDPVLHTLVVGAARPSDFDEHVLGEYSHTAGGQGGGVHDHERLRTVEGMERLDGLG